MVGAFHWWVDFAAKHPVFSVFVLCFLLRGGQVNFQLDIAPCRQTYHPPEARWILALWQDMKAIDTGPE
jgi:hypothetical protein